MPDKYLRWCRRELSMSHKDNQRKWIVKEKDDLQTQE